MVFQQLYERKIILLNFKQINARLQIEDIRKVTDEDRDKTKRIMYALMYGAGASKLVEFLHIDFNQANEILQKFSGKKINYKIWPLIYKFSTTHLPGTIVPTDRVK